MKQVTGLIAANYSPEIESEIITDRPLAAMPFAGRYRLIDFALSNISNVGIRSVGIIMPANFRPILDHLGSGKEWSLDKKRGGMFILPGVNYGYLQKGSKFPIRDILNNEEFLYRSDEEYVIISSANQVFNYDLDILINKHISAKADISLLYKETDADMEDHPRYLVTKGDKVDSIIHVKPLHEPKLFADVLILSIDLLKKFCEWYKSVPHIGLMDIIKENLGNLNVNSVAMDGYLYRIEDTNSYFKANMELLKKEVREELFSSNTIFTKVRDNMPTRYLSGCKVSNSLFANGCVIGGKVENSILARGVVVEEGASVKNCILMQKTKIRAGAVLENIILDKYSEIESGTVLKKSDGEPYYLRKLTRL